MISPEDLIATLKSGNDVRVVKNASDNRLLVVRNRTSKAERSIEISLEHFDQFMVQTVSLLAARNGSGLRVHVGRDHYGRQWLEVRWGLLGHRLSRLGLSPRYIALLCDALADREQAEAVA